MTLITQAELARRKKVTRAAVTQWKNEGWLVMNGRLIDLEATESRMQKYASSRSKRLTPAATVTVKPGLPLNTTEPTPLLEPCTAHLAEPSDRAIVAALPMLAYRIPASAAIMAVHVGAPLAVANALFRALSVAVMDDVQEQLDALGVPSPGEAADWSDAPLWDPDGFMQVNWPVVATEAGETVDPAAWEAHWRTLPAYAPEGDAEALGALPTGHPPADPPRRRRRTAAVAP